MRVVIKCLVWLIVCIGMFTFGTEINSLIFDTPTEVIMQNTSYCIIGTMFTIIIGWYLVEDFYKFFADLKKYKDYYEKLGDDEE